MTAVLPFLRGQRNGHIVNVSSIAGLAPMAGLGLYAAAKLGIASGLTNGVGFRSSEYIVFRPTEKVIPDYLYYQTGIGAHALWSISRGLARGVESRGEYKSMMDLADMPRQGDLNGRGKLSLKALKDFVLWLLRVCLDQVQFMSGLFVLNELRQRLRILVERNSTLKPEAAALLEEALMRGKLERGEVARITGLPERTARRVLTNVTELGLLASSTPKGPVSLRFPENALEELFPRLYPQV